MQSPRPTSRSNLKRPANTTKCPSRPMRVSNVSSCRIPSASCAWTDRSIWCSMSSSCTFLRTSHIFGTIRLNGSITSAETENRASYGYGLRLQDPIAYKNKISCPWNRKLLPTMYWMAVGEKRSCMVKCSWPAKIPFRRGSCLR